MLSIDTHVLEILLFVLDMKLSFYGHYKAFCVLEIHRTSPNAMACFRHNVVYIFAQC
jgi:hypothetical protein